MLMLTMVLALVSGTAMAAPSEAQEQSTFLEFYYNDNHYTAGLAYDGGEDFFRLLPNGNEFGADAGMNPDGFEAEFYIGILRDYGEESKETEDPAPYPLIQNVNFTLEDQETTVGEGDCFSLSEQKDVTTPAKGQTRGVTLTAHGGMQGSVVLRYSFEIALPGQEALYFEGSQKNYFVTDETYDVTAPEEIRELNKILKSQDALLEYVEGELGMDEGTTNKNIPINLYLPSVTYEGIVSVNCDALTLGIRGVTDDDGGNTTIIKGGLAVNGSYLDFGIGNVDFVAEEDVTMQLGPRNEPEKFTCGILGAGSYVNYSNCTFTGFDYGVRSTEKDGWVCGETGNVFENNDVAIYMDCKGCESPMNSVTSACIFSNNDTAVKVVSLPKNVTRRTLRFVDCVFDDNENDFDVTDVQGQGRFYFWKNYYTEGEPRINSTGADVEVIVSPMYSSADMTTLTIDDMLPTAIFNREADDFCFQVPDTENEMRVTVLDDNERELASWTFNEATPAMLMRMPMRAAAPAVQMVSDAFNAGVNIEKKGADTLVTVTDSRILREEKPSLGVAVDNGEASVLHGGKITSTRMTETQATFQVKDGGTYVLTGDEFTVKMAPAPTCTAPGKYVYTNGDGTRSYEEDIPAVGHDFTDTSKETCANCEEQNPNYVPPYEPSDKPSYETPTYRVTVEQPDNGTVKLSRKNAERGDKVTVTVTPDEGFALDGLTITDKNGKNISYKDNGDDTYTFTMPGRNITIHAEFTAIMPEIDVTTLFADVSKEAWYVDAVSYVVNNGLMNGYGNGVFSPDDKLSRAMLAQILYCREGRPEVESCSVFADVKSGDWYVDAVTWAASNNIVGGYGNGIFGSNDSITREQFAVMLWRYAGSPATEIVLDGFADADSISDYAMEALTWATQNAVMQGNGNGILNPRGTVTRAHVAQMLMNYFKG